MSANPWENKPHSLLATSKEKRHMRLGGLRSVLQSHGIIEEGEKLNEVATVAPRTEKYFHLLDTITELREEKQRLLDDLDAHSLTEEQARLLTQQNLEDSIEQIEACAKYVETIIHNEDKIRNALETRKRRSYDKAAAIKVNPLYQRDFYEFFRLTGKLLTNKASKLENIRWSQNSAKHMKSWEKVQTIFDPSRTGRNTKSIVEKDQTIAKGSFDSERKAAVIRP